MLCRLLWMLALASCRWNFGLVGDDAPPATTDDAGFIVDDGGTRVSCTVDTDCGRCQRCENQFCQRATFVDVDLGQRNACALDERGEVWCWGSNDYFIVAPDLGAGGEVVPRPRRRTDIAETIESISVGWGVLYMRATTGALVTRGAGDGNASDAQPIWSRIAANHFNGCAMTTSNQIFCSGQGQYGALGDGVAMTGSFGLRQFGSDSDWASVSTGDSTCAVKQDGTLWCVGLNDRGQLGRGTITPYETTIVQVGNDADWASVETGEQRACALKTNGDLYCFGSEFLTNDSEPDPVRHGAQSGWTTLELYFRCGTAWRGGIAYWACHNDLYLHQALGVGTDFDWTPMPIVADVDTPIVLGGQAACFRQNGAWMCWGDSTVGAVGVDELATVAPTPLCE